MRKYQRNRVPSREGDVERREEPKRERFLAQIGAQLAKLGNLPSPPPALQVPSAVNPPDGSDLGQFWKLKGRPGGQIGLGGTGSAQSATIGSTLHATKGFVYFGWPTARMAFNETLGYLGIGTLVPAAVLHIYGSGTASQSAVPSGDVAPPPGSDWGKVGAATFADCVNDANDATYARYTANLGSTALIMQFPAISNPGTTTGFQLKFTLRAVSDKTDFRMSFNLSNASGGASIVTDIFYGGPSNTTHPARWQADVTSSFAVYTYNLTAGEAAIINYSSVQRITCLFAGNSSNSAHSFDVSRIEFVVPGAAGATTLFKAENAVAGAIFGSFDTDFDWSFTGTNKISFRNGPSAASGLRLYSDTGLARLEAGSSAGLLKILLLGGYGASALTSLRVAGQTMISDTASPAAPGALLDVFPQSDQKVLKLRPHSSQTNDILQVRNNADASTFAAIDSTGKIVANIGLQLSAQSPAAGKIATSSDGSGNFTWSLASTIAATWAYVAKTSTYSITTTDGVIDCTSGTFTVTLPTAVGVAGRMYAIKNSGTGVITVATTSSQTIDGSTTALLQVQNVCIVVVSDGANWKVI